MAESVHRKPIRFGVGFFILMLVVVAGAARLWLLDPAESQPDRWRFEGMALGTAWSVLMASPPEPSEASAQLARNAIEAALENVDAKMSTWREDSELSRFNRHASTEPFPMSAETLKVIRAAEQISEESGGAFDVTVGPLVNAWGFGPDERTMVGPDDALLKELLARVGYENLVIEDEAVRKAQPAVYVDLSAIAKGYAVDAIAASLDTLGYEDYMVEVGGEIRVRGLRPDGEPWRIAIERPAEEQRIIEMVLPLSDISLATSGDYRNYYEVEGQRLSHTIDPATGRPITHKLASVSVLHKECMMADGYATALTVLGPDKGLDLAERLGLPVFMLVREDVGFKGVMSSAFEPYARATAGLGPGGGNPVE